MTPIWAAALRDVTIAQSEQKHKNVQLSGEEVRFCATPDDDAYFGLRVNFVLNLDDASNDVCAVGVDHERELALRPLN
jgi:hypothetical protein